MLQREGGCNGFLSCTKSLASCYKRNAANSPTLLLGVFSSCAVPSWCVFLIRQQCWSCSFSGYPNRKLSKNEAGMHTCLNWGAAVSYHRWWQSLINSASSTDGFPTLKVLATCRIADYCTALSTWHREHMQKCAHGLLPGMAASADKVVQGIIGQGGGGGRGTGRKLSSSTSPLLDLLMLAIGLRLWIFNFLTRYY